MKTLTPKEIIDAIEALDSVDRRKVAKALGKMGKKTTAENLTAPAAQRYNPGSMSTATLQAEPATIGQKIRQIRKEKGITLVELAEKVGITQPSLSLIERDKFTPRSTTLTCIALALGVRVGKLLPVG